MTPVRPGFAAAVLALTAVALVGLRTAAQTPSAATQGGPATGTWQVIGGPAPVAYAPWTFVLTQTGTTLTGTVRQNGGLGGPVRIHDGTVHGNEISFKVDSPSGGRIITFTGTIAGDSIDLRRSVEDQVHEPSGEGIFGASGAMQFTARRADPVAAAMALGTALPGSALHLVDDVLNQYEGGHFDVAVGSLPPPSELNQFATLLAAEAPSWIGSGTASDSLHRRVVVASVALEAVQRGLAGSPPFAVRTASARLIEWARELLPSTSPLERTWYLASIALAERTNDTVFLNGLGRLKGSPGEPAVRARLGAAIAYLPSVQALLPDEPRVRLSCLVADDLLGATANETGWLSAPQDLTSSFMKPFSGYYEALVRAFADVASTESIRGEAHLRAGVIEYRLRHTDAALTHLDQVEPWTRDPYLVYLSRFFRGKTRELEGNREAAEAAFRSALAIVPNAEAASTALATSLFLRDARAEAYGLVQNSLGAQPTTVDPWRLYMWGDYRLAPELMQNLREALR